MAQDSFKLIMQLMLYERELRARGGDEYVGVAHDIRKIFTDNGFTIPED